MEIRNGYELIYRVLQDSQNDLTQFLNEQNGRETSEVEFKASFLLDETERSKLPSDEEKDEKQKKLIWNILSDIIAIANSSGGCVLFGINDDGKYAEGYLQGLSIDKYELQLFSELFDNKKGWTFGKVKYMLDERHSQNLKNCCEIIEAKAYSKTILVILIKPAEKPIMCVTGPKDQWGEFKKEILLHRGENDDLARKEKLEGIEEIERYIQNRDIKSTRFQDKYNRIFPQQKARLLPYAISLLIALLGVFTICLYLYPRNTLIVFVVVIVVAALGIFILPLCRPIPKIVPIPGKKTPDQIVVRHPLLTIESHCADHGVWWHTVDTCQTCYGDWKLQRNKAFGNFRILDPRHIRRSWGTQEMMLPVFEELKTQLRECCVIEKD